ncbi:MAG: 2-C-methyl-D-erythritol 4-phosphate cytidylyltransferase [Eubacteriales bacterium]
MAYLRNTAIVLAGGQGTRMNSQENKQYMLLQEKPVLYYCLETFQNSFIDEIILVVAKGQVEYCKKQFIEKCQFTKIIQIVEGGKERYHSVYQGLLKVRECDYVYIHDGARPFIEQEHLNKLKEEVLLHQACVLGMPVKDTIKIADSQLFGCDTPNRNDVWMIQTPQVFSFSLVYESYKILMQEEGNLKKNGIFITDDAMVVECFRQQKIKFVVGSYGNIKLTTPEDMRIAEALLLEKLEK